MDQLAPNERYSPYRVFSAEEWAAFRDGTPYQGEDILFDPGRPEHFLVRCTRDATSIPGTCLYERRIGSADLTARFPRDWLDNWQSVSAGLDKLLASLSPPTS